MKKIFFYIIILLLAAAFLYFLILKGMLPINVVPGARTMYIGSVGIEPVSLEEVRATLEKNDCHPFDYTGESQSRCRYERTMVSYEQKDGIMVYPNGPGWGPLSFSITEEKLWSEKDIPGAPDADKFKDQVRSDIEIIAGSIRIKEDSWKIIEMKYPWTAIY